MDTAGPNPSSSMSTILSATAAAVRAADETLAPLIMEFCDIFSRDGKFPLAQLGQMSPASSGSPRRCGRTSPYQAAQFETLATCPRHRRYSANFGRMLIIPPDQRRQLNHLLSRTTRPLAVLAINSENRA